MQLAGRLSLTTLGDLLGTLSRAEARGTLELTEDSGPVAGRVHRMHFAQGQVYFIESPLGAKLLGELLVAKGWLSRLRHFELLTHIRQNPSKTTGQWLTELQWVPGDVLRVAAHEQAANRLSALYQLADARVTYRIARPAPNGILSAEPLTTREALQGRPRARDRNSTPDVMAPPQSPVDPMRRRALLLLGLDTHADVGDVKRAFRRMAAKLHPDRHLVAPEKHQKLVRERFAQVSQAYHLLTG